MIGINPILQSSRDSFESTRNNFFRCRYIYDIFCCRCIFIHCVYAYDYAFTQIDRTSSCNNAKQFEENYLRARSAIIHHHCLHKLHVLNKLIFQLAFILSFCLDENSHCQRSLYRI